MARWEPMQYLEEQHPDVRVVEWALPAPLQGCVHHKKRTIYIRPGLSPAAYRSTLAYEIAQLQQGPAPVDACLAAARDRAAVEWAARMLISSEEFAAAWGECLDLEAMAASVGVDVPMFRARIRAASDADQDAAIEAITATRLSA